MPLAIENIMYMIVISFSRISLNTADVWSD